MISKSLLAKSGKPALALFHPPRSSAAHQLPISGGINKSIPYFFWPENSLQTLTYEQKISVIVAFMLCARSVDDYVNNWKTFIITLICLGFPEFKNVLVDGASEMVDGHHLPATFITAACDAAQGLINSFKAGIESPDPIPLQLPDNLPEVQIAAYSTEHVESSAMESVYGFISLVIFLMGKDTSTTDRRAIKTARPDAIRRKYKLDNARYFLDGGGALSDEAQDGICQAWLRMPFLRRLWVPEFAKFKDSPGGPSEVVYTTFKLLEYSGMQHAYYVFRLVDALPWVINIPILKPALTVYVTSISELSTVNPLIQPFYKLIYGDATKIFYRNAMNEIVSCAILYGTRTAPSLRRFVVSQSAVQAVQDFLVAAKGRNVIVTGEAAIEEALEEEDEGEHEGPTEGTATLA
jgi:hypothetical protein